MRTAALFALALAASLTANADFSYTTTQKSTGGMMGAMAGTAADRVNKVYLKGQKMMTTSGDISSIMDFGAQTITTVNNAQKTWSVKKFSDLGMGAAANADVSIDVKETGQTKNVNGFNASEVIITMSMEMDAGRGGPPMKAQMEMDIWVSPDVPGAGEMRAFYQRNAANFPWSAMASGSGNASMQKAIAQMQRKIADLKGVPVEHVMRLKSAGGSMPQMPQMTPEQMAQMQAAMAKMQAASKDGGAGSAAMQQAMANMANMGRGGSAGGSGSLMEITSDSSGFSTASIPDSVFAIPAGYKQTQ